MCSSKQRGRDGAAIYLLLLQLPPSMPQMWGFLGIAKCIAHCGRKGKAAWCYSHIGLCDCKDTLKWVKSMTRYWRGVVDRELRSPNFPSQAQLWEPGFVGWGGVRVQTLPYMWVRCGITTVHCQLPGSPWGSRRWVTLPSAHSPLCQSYVSTSSTQEAAASVCGR